MEDEWTAADQAAYNERRWQEERAERLVRNAMSLFAAAAVILLLVFIAWMQPARELRCFNELTPFVSTESDHVIHDAYDYCKARIAAEREREQ